MDALREGLGTQLSQAGKAVSQTVGRSWAPACSRGDWVGKRPRGLAQRVQAATRSQDVCPQWHEGEKLLLGQASPRMSEITCPEGSRGVESHSSPPQWSGVGTAEAWPPTPDSSSRASSQPLSPCPRTCSGGDSDSSEAGPLHRLRGLHALLGAAGPSLPASLPQESLFPARVVYDLLFFFIVIIIVLNLIFGVIIDTFADLRSEKQKKEEILKTTCFICGEAGLPPGGRGRQQPQSALPRSCGPREPCPGPAAW